MLFTTQAKLLGNLHAARATNTFERRFQNPVKTPLIVIEDFGLKPMRQPHDEVFHDLIAERYERDATIVTSSLDYSKWGDAFPTSCSALSRSTGCATVPSDWCWTATVTAGHDLWPKATKRRLQKGGEKG